MDKHQRHRLIAHIVSSRPVKSQDALRAALEQQGVRATQGTLSRDLRELGVVKGAGGYALPEKINPARDGRELADALALLLRSASVAGSLVVVKTSTANANALAVHLDNHPPQGVVGCIAGDDTIFLATNSPREAQSVARALIKLAGGGE